MPQCLIGFYGKYIPLQGVEYIVRAAGHPLCRELQFRLIGDGQTYSQVRALSDHLGLKNIEFIPKLPYEKLLEEISLFDISLGIFGNTPKTEYVIPNKVYDAAMLGKAIITADTRAIREVFTDNQDIVLCQVASPDALAEKISMLRDNVSLRQRVGAGARAVYVEKATPYVIGKELLSSFQKHFESDPACNRSGSEVK